jgi:hypothetical protein
MKNTQKEKLSLKKIFFSLSILLFSLYQLVIMTTFKGHLTIYVFLFALLFTVSSSISFYFLVKQFVLYIFK